MEHYRYLYPNDFWHLRKIYHFDPYKVLLAFAANKPVLLMTGFVLQGNIQVLLKSLGVWFDESFQTIKFSF